LKKSLQTGQVLQIERWARPLATDRPDVEVRVLPGLTTWLAMIDSAAVVFPERQDRLQRERTVLRAPAVLAVVSWAFHQARPTPPFGATLPQLSQWRCGSCGAFRPG
jgi:hypothetical protein